MGVSILLALPALLGGFLFARFSYWTRFAFGRLQGQKLFLFVAVLGLVFFVSSAVWIGFGAWPVRVAANSSFWANLDLPPHSGKAIAPFFCAAAWLLVINATTVFASGRTAFVAQLRARLADHSKSSFCVRAQVTMQQVLSFGSHLVIPEPNVQRWVYEKLLENGLLGDELEGFLFEASQNYERVLVDTDNRKVYLAIVAEPLNRPAAEDTWLVLWPFRSGYRDEETLDVTYVVQYEVITYFLVSSYLQALEKKLQSQDGDSDPDDTRADIRRVSAVVSQLERSFPGVEKERLESWRRFIPLNKITSISPYSSNAALVHRIPDDESDESHAVARGKKKKTARKVAAKKKGPRKKRAGS